MNDFMKKIDEFCDYLLIDKHYSKNTIESYKRDLLKFYEYNSVNDLQSIGKDEVKEYLKHLNEDNMNERSIARNISALKSKDFSYVEREILLLRKTTTNKILKIIVETAYLNEEEKNKIANIILNTGVDFLKTSTGFATAGAVIEDIKFFKSILKNDVKIKASGGISTYKQAKELIKAGASRLGTSKSLQIISQDE